MPSDEVLLQLLLNYCASIPRPAGAVGDASDSAPLCHEANPSTTTTPQSKTSTTTDNTNTNMAPPPHSRGQAARDEWRQLYGSQEDKRLGLGAGAGELGPDLNPFPSVARQGTQRSLQWQFPQGPVVKHVSAFMMEPSAQVSR